MARFASSLLLIHIVQEFSETSTNVLFCMKIWEKNTCSSSDACHAFARIGTYEIQLRICAPHDLTRLARMGTYGAVKSCYFQAIVSGMEKNGFWFWVKMAPAILYAAVGVGVFVACSFGIWWLFIRAFASGDVFRHPIGSIIGFIAALPVLAPAVILTFILGLGCYRTFQRATGRGVTGAADQKVAAPVDPLE